MTSGEGLSPPRKFYLFLADIGTNTFLCKMHVTAASDTHKLSKFGWYSIPGGAPAPTLATPMFCSCIGYKHISFGLYLFQKCCVCNVQLSVWQ